MKHDQIVIPGGGQTPVTRRWDLALAALLLLVTLYTGLFILRDRQTLYHDPVTNLLPAEALREALHQGGSAAWQRWLAATDFRPPLPSVLYQPALRLLDPVRAIRLTDLLAFLATLWLIHGIGRRLGGAWVGVWAATLFAGFPLVLGWSHGVNADPLIWFSLTLLFRVLLTLNLRSPWQASLLGLCVGLCLATRLLCWVYLVGPLLWVLALRVRDRWSLLNLAAAGAWALATSGWWYALRARAVLSNLWMSSETQSSVPHASSAIGHYLDSGVGWAVLAALLAGGVLLRRRALAAPTAWLFGLWIAVPALQLTLVWDAWARYALPLLPQCALLLSLALGQLSAPLRPGWRWAVRVGVLGLGLGPMVLLLATPTSPGPLHTMLETAGILWPDTRPHDGLARALFGLPAAQPVLLISELHDPFYIRGLQLTHGPRAPRLAPPPDPGLAGTLAPETRVRHVLRVRPACEGLARERCETYAPKPSWRLLSTRLKLIPIRQTRDPGGILFTLHRLPRPLRGDELPRP